MDEIEICPLKKKTEISKNNWQTYPFQETHFLKFWTSVGQPLQSVGQIICGWKVKPIHTQDMVYHS